jgi:hypothetical protein
MTGEVRYNRRTYAGDLLEGLLDTGTGFTAMR